jgi:pimeloyl-ACP methyl ester carboxylesterase
MAQISPVTGHYITIEVDSCEYKVFYLENGSGQPLICQHTAGCHNHQWRGLLEDEEITKKYRVIAYDLPRHGKSDPPHNKEWWKEEYKLTAQHYVNFIVTLCDALDREKPIFMGSSFGGNVALQLAWRCPERFRAVIPVEAGDGEIIQGIASIDESAISGESAAVIREAGGDRSGVTGGTLVVSDQIIIRITSGAGESFLDRMIVLVEGAIRQHMTHVAQNTRDGVFSGMNDLVEKLSGQKPMEMIDYIIKNKALFI